MLRAHAARRLTMPALNQPHHTLCKYFVNSWEGVCLKEYSCLQYRMRVKYNMQSSSYGQIKNFVTSTSAGVGNGTSYVV